MFNNNLFENLNLEIDNEINTKQVDKFNYRALILMWL